MGPVVGIDLGTTNTVVGVVIDGQAAALADENGEKLIPSVVSFHPSGNVLVGRSARERRLMDAKNTIYSIKRLIGRSWDTEEVRRARARFPFEMREGPGQAALVVARGETYTLPEISAFVLRQAKSVAESALGQQIDRAVITVPANFNDLQRAATKVAGRVAGLEVLRILNEPTAAALAYGYGKGHSERLAVYDFGGGTFDVTLLDLSDNVFEVLATAGNTFLGGDDIDLAIAEAMADAFLAQHRYDARTDSQAFERLRASAETLKMRLSSLPEASIEVPEVAHGPGGKPLSLAFNMTRAELERLAAPIIDNTFAVCRDAMSIARMSPGDFDQILLVGGSTRIPLVRQRVEEFFNKTVLGNISPDEVVAIGAAIQASALTGAERRRGEIPSAPKPARAPSYPFISTKTQPPSARKSEPPTARKSQPPPLPARRTMRTAPGIRRTNPPSGGAVPTPAQPHAEPNTRPFGRARMATAPGLSPDPTDAVAPTENHPFVVPPRQATRKERTTTASGHGAPATLDGLGARGRIPTGAGLGPEADAAQAKLESSPRIDSALDGSTLMSASEAASRARREADIPLPVVGVGEDARLVSGPDIPLPLVGMDDTSAEDSTQRAQAAQKALSADEVAERYGNLPLIMPEGGVQPAQPPKAPARPGLGSTKLIEAKGGMGSTQLLGAQDDLGSTAVLDAKPPAPPLRRPPQESAPPLSVDDSEIEEDTGITHVAPDPRALRAMAAPMSTDEVTAVRRSPTSPTVDLPSEDSLPIPEAPAWNAPAAGETAGQWNAPPPQAFAPPAPPAPPAAPPPAAPTWGGIPSADPPQAQPPAPPPAAPTWGGGPAVDPAAVALGGFAPVAPKPVIQEQPRAPLLVDVTPLSLSVETVGGYCDTVIERNTPVPCERTRSFVTASDQQTTVRVRVSQGESNRFGDNTLLGEVELAGLRPAPRGQVEIAVSFNLDADGILDVQARDTMTGHSTSARVRLVGLPESPQVDAMIARHAAHPSM